MDIAKPIVAGCVNSNSACKKHGDDLINAIAAQLVSDSIAAQNKQSANAAAAAAAAQQNNTALQQQLQSMQQQMASMQQQNSEQINSLQQQLAESQRETQNAVASVAESASRAATATNPDTGLTPAQEAAAKSGVSDDVIARATITGQILTSMEGVDQSLNNLKTTMRDAFRYAKCNEVNGNNCSAPKRVAKFRELANKFMEPYDALADNLDDALFTAQSVGVDLGNIYMFFSGSCNRWAEYVCRGNYVTRQVCDSLITQTLDDGSTKTTRGDCRDVTGLPTYELSNCDENTHKSKSNSGVTRGGHDCYIGNVIPPEDLVACTVNRILDANEPEIQEKILNPDQTSTGSVRIGCASDGINSGLIKRRRSSSKNKSGIDIDLLEIILNQKEYSNKYTDAKNICGTNDKDATIRYLKAATVSKALKKDSTGVCCTEPEKCNIDCYDLDQDVSYVDPIFALCDTHAWNAGIESNDDINGSGKSDNREKMNEIIALKTTVIAQQMYKQYATLEQMIKQLKVMLEKEVLKASVQVAGGTSSDDDTTDKVEFSSCVAMGAEEALGCVRANYAKLKPFVDKGNMRNDVVKQIVSDCNALNSAISSIYLSGSTQPKFDAYNKCNNENTVKSRKKEALDPIATGISYLNNIINRAKAEEAALNRRY